MRGGKFMGMAECRQRGTPTGGGEAVAQMVGVALSGEDGIFRSTNGAGTMGRLSAKRLKIGGVFIAAGLLLANETVAWIWNKALDWLRGNWATLPWFQILGMLILVSGLALVLWPRPKVPTPAPPPSRAARVWQVFQKGNRLADVITKDRKLAYYMRDDARDPDVLAANAASLSLSLEKEGFPALPTPTDLPAYSYLVGVEAYFSTLFPLVRDGHIEEAEETAAELVASLGPQMRAFNTYNWFINRY